jgi:hypothetical protein
LDGMTFRAQPLRRRPLKTTRATSQSTRGSSRVAFGQLDSSGSSVVRPSSVRSTGQVSSASSARSYLKSRVQGAGRRARRLYRATKKGHRPFILPKTKFTNCLANCSTVMQRPPRIQCRDGSSTTERYSATNGTQPMTLTRRNFAIGCGAFASSALICARHGIGDPEWSSTRLQSHPHRCSQAGERSQPEGHVRSACVRSREGYANLWLLGANPWTGHSHAPRR